MTTQSTVIVTPLSPSHIVMLAMLAQHGPLAKESVMRKWNRLTKPTISSERAGFLLTRHIEPACAEQCLTAADPDSS